MRPLEGRRQKVEGRKPTLLLCAFRFLASAFCLLPSAFLLLAQGTRIASDFEIAQMEKQLARSREFEAQLSGRLNLGDVRVARNELSLARAEYGKALDLAQRERLAARRDSALGRYASATSYAALAQAKLGRDAAAFALLEEAARYASDDAESWNLYASAMRILRHPRKAIAAARNSVAIAAGKPDRLDLAVYQHALATALVEADEYAEAEKLLVKVTESLRSPAFETLQREVARQESFEIYSSARGDVAAYVSLLNRAQLRLASIYERRGDRANARVQYERVLAARSDDVTALAALGRYDEAFAANPFSMTLVRQYQRHLREHPQSGGIGVQLALQQLARAETRAARATLDALLEKFPSNETLRTLRREAEGPRAAIPSPNPTAAELRGLLNAFEQLTPDELATLNRSTFTSGVQFEGTVFESGTLEDAIPFRFSGPVQFEGNFDINTPLRLTYRILGVTRKGESDALLLEPVRVEGAR